MNPYPPFPPEEEIQHFDLIRKICYVCIHHNFMYLEAEQELLINNKEYAIKMIKSVLG